MQGAWEPKGHQGAICHSQLTPGVGQTGQVGVPTQHPLSQPVCVPWGWGGGAPMIDWVSGPRLSHCLLSLGPLGCPSLCPLWRTFPPVTCPPPLFKLPSFPGLLLWLPDDHKSEATGHILAARGLCLDVRLIYWVGFIVRVYKIKNRESRDVSKSDFLFLKTSEAVGPLSHSPEQGPPPCRVPPAPLLCMAQAWPGRVPAVLVGLWWLQARVPVWIPGFRAGGPWALDDNSMVRHSLISRDSWDN